MPGYHRSNTTLLLLLLLLLIGTQGDESSGTYLRNVVSELRQLHGLGPNDRSPMDAQTQESQRLYSRPELPDRRSPLNDTFTALPQVSQVAENWQRRRQRKKPGYADSENDSGEPSASAQEEGPTLLGLPTRELAAMYRKAVELGAPVRYQNLMDSFGQHQEPKILVERPAAISNDGQYAYYFYPLDTFQHELVNDYGHRTTPPMKLDSAPVENNKKEMTTMNPLLVGVGSFLGMALVFMLSAFLYPRLLHMMSFPFESVSRVNSRADVSYLASVVSEAIDFYNARNRKRSGNWNRRLG